MAYLLPVMGLGLAYLSNLAFKFGLVVFVGGKTMARIVAAGFLATAFGIGARLIFLHG